MLAFIIGGVIVGISMHFTSSSVSSPTSVVNDSILVLDIPGWSSGYKHVIELNDELVYHIYVQHSYNSTQRL